MNSPKYCDYSQLWIDTQSAFVVITIFSALYHVFLILGIIMSLVEKMGHPIISFILIIQTLYPSIVRSVVYNQTLFNARTAIYTCGISIMTNVTIAIVIIMNFYSSDLGSYVSQNRTTNMTIYFTLDIIILVVLDILQLVLLEIQILPRVSKVDIILKTNRMDKVIETELVSLVEDLIYDSAQVQLKDRIFESLSLHYVGKSIHNHDIPLKSKQLPNTTFNTRTSTNHKDTSIRETRQIHKYNNKQKKQRGLKDFSILKISHPFIAYVLFRNIDGTFTKKSSKGSTDPPTTDTINSSKLDNNHRVNTNTRINSSSINV